MSTQNQSITKGAHVTAAGSGGALTTAKPSDPWQALHPRYAEPLRLPLLSPNGVDLKAIRAAYSCIPDVPAGTSFRWGNMEPVGVPVELPAGINSEAAAAYLLHTWALAYQALVFDSGLPVELAGRWGLFSDSQAAFLVWINIGGIRLVLLPTLSLQGRTIHMSLAHCVLLHQGWMTGHDPQKHGDMVHLSSQYDFLFQQPGSAYYEVLLGYFDKERLYRYWSKHRTWIDSLLRVVGGGKFGLGDGEINFTGFDRPAYPIFFSEELRSFVHFKIGEPGVPSGSPPGVTYSHVRTKIAEMMGEWRRTFTAPIQTKLERPKRLGIEIEYLEEQ